MKLSEAIRLGSTMMPQHHDSKSFFVTEGSYKTNGPLGLEVGGVECGCAMGAAMAAIGREDDDAISGRNGWPRKWGLKRPMECPACDKDDHFYDVITHLNDDHRWTREAIADWVETIENQQESAQKAVSEQEVKI